MLKILWCFFLVLVCSPGKAQTETANEQSFNFSPSTHPLKGDVPPAVRGRRPLGPADGTLPMERMILAFRMSPEARTNLEDLLASQANPASPLFHAWLTPEAFAAAFGPGPEEVAKAAAWLRSQGFTVERVARGGMSLIFTGDVAAVERAFRTPIQRFEVEGRERVANALDPCIPEELAGTVQGVVSLHNLPRKPAHSGARSLAEPSMDLGGEHFLAPADFAVIYNLGPLQAAGDDGAGATIAVIGRSDPGLTDVSAFQSQFGVPAGRTTIKLNGKDPGLVDFDEALEANLDMQWSGATAPGASILFVCSATTSATDGVDLSSQYAVDNDLADVLTVSFGECEADLGQTELAFYHDLWAQAAAQGMTVCVASGDAGASGCSSGNDDSGSGQAVSGLSSTPNNVCVGGTMFLDAGGSYWSSTNSATEGSALGYLPEAAWNESGIQSGGYGLWAGGGGASSVYGKPAWQAAPGVPGDSARDVPDLAFSAATHDGYLMRSQGTLFTVGGTSASTPSFAGIMARLVQSRGGRQGNVNAMLYSLASLQSVNPGAAVFHDVLTGGNAVPDTPGFSAGPGYDQATGLGSLDAAAFVQARSSLVVTPVKAASPQKLGAPFGQAFTIAGGAPPYTCSVASGQLPPGVVLAPDGTLSGITTTEGTYAFVVKAADGAGRIGAAALAVQVGPVAVTAEVGPSGLLLGTAATYSATVTGAADTSLAWKATGGDLTVTEAGASFQAAAPGTYVLTATAKADPQRSVSFVVEAHDADFMDANNGKPLTGLDALYLAGFAGAPNLSLDLNGDGVVDDQDLTVLLNAMGW